MMDENALSALLGALSTDTEPEHRRLLLKALVAIGPTPGAWRAAAPIVTRWAPQLSRGPDLPLLARIPLRSVRDRLRAIASDRSHPEALTTAIALAGVQDAAGLTTLLHALREAPAEAVAHALAALPLEAAGVAAAELRPGLASDDASTRLWAAIALARVEVLAPLEQLWDALVRPASFGADDGGQRLFREPPPLFHGDPSVTVAHLATVRPLPDRVVRFLIALRDKDYDEAWTSRDPASAEPARNATLLVAGLTGTCDQYGHPVGAAAPPAEPAAPPAGDDEQAIALAERLIANPWRGPHPAIEPHELALLAKVPPALSARVIERSLDHLASQALAWHDRPAFVLGNALLEIATALPGRLPLRVATLLLQPAAGMLPRDALAWTLARAGPARALAALTPLIARSRGEERTRWLEWLVRIANQVDAPAPFGGAGGEQATPERAVPLIDDTLPAPQPDATAGRHIAAKTRTAYPDIAADDVHPVATRTVNFTVRLSDRPSTDTTGQVRVPAAAEDVSYTLQVHLLFGAASAWDTLTWSPAAGTTKAAAYALAAPGVEGERALVEVRANFYLNSRWCGTGQRNLDVRRDDAVAPTADIAPPAVPPWRAALVLQPDALPPDLIVRIEKGGTAGDFVWSCLSPHLDFPAPRPGADGMSLKEDAATFVRNTFAPLANKPLDRLKLADVEGAGEKIYRATPAYFKDCYWALWHDAARAGYAFESIQIVTDEPCIPWELMRISDRSRGAGVAPELLAIRHCVGRWLAGESSALRQRITVRRVAVAASSYGNVAAVSAKLPWAATEHALLVGSYHADAVPLTSTALLDFLEKGAAQAVHLACHGKMSIANPDASVLVMEDTPNDLTPLSVARAEVCAGLGTQHPLVFLNACEVGASAAALSLVAGFPAAFLYAGASALVSPLWAVNDERAHSIAEAFYREVFAAGGAKTLGEVMRELRSLWKSEQHLTYLAYVLYGDPMARIDYRGTDSWRRPWTNVSC